VKAKPSKQGTKNTPAVPKGSRTQEQSSTETVVPKEQPPADTLHARITVRAYELYVERGRQEGCAEQDWLDAEREVLSHTFSV
jgi:hypothetical protein